MTTVRQRRGRGYAITEAEITVMVQLYRQGVSIRGIMTELGRSYGGVHRALTAAGVQLRSRGGDWRRAGAAVAA